MHINIIKIPVQVSFWVIMQPTDGVIMANKWLTSPLRAILAWCEQLQSQVLYFKTPTTPLLAGGKTLRKADTKHSGPQENNGPSKECHKDKPGDQTEQREEDDDDKDEDARWEEELREVLEDYKEETSTRLSGVSTIKASISEP